MALTPVDVLHTQFKTALRGYNRNQVDSFLRGVRESLEQAIAEKADLQRRLEALEEEVERVRKIESTLTGSLALAQKTADELRENAHRRAEMIVREAEQERVRMTIDAQKEVERHRSDIALLQATRDRFEAEMRGMLSAYLDLLGRGWPREVVVRETDQGIEMAEDADPATDSAEVA